MKIALAVVCLICSLTAWGQEQGRPALDDLIKTAEQGDAEAQFNLGVIYDEGQGVPQDYAEAAKWYRMAAEQGDADAQFILGVMYDEGQGVPKDDTEAVKWYRLAAEQDILPGDVLAGLVEDFLTVGVDLRTTF